jgi:hypothetical protein
MAYDLIADSFISQLSNFPKIMSHAEMKAKPSVVRMNVSITSLASCVINKTNKLIGTPAARVKINDLKVNVIILQPSYKGSHAACMAPQNPPSPASPMTASPAASKAGLKSVAAASPKTMPVVSFATLPVMNAVARSSVELSMTESPLLQHHLPAQRPVQATLQERLRQSPQR